MEHLELVGEKVKLVVDDRALTVLSDTKLETVSSAVYQGGFKKTKTILNVKVPAEYDQQRLHEKPELLIKNTAKEIGIPVKGAIGMITAANIKQFSWIKKQKNKLTINAIVTAGCQCTESAGEQIEDDQRKGTINTIVILDGKPTESCLVGCLLTATEAKTAALNDLDLRSRYSGDLATGTITDSTVIASTGKGDKLRYAGPPSKLGSLVGHCVREAVKETIMRCDNLSLKRSVPKRLEERGLSVEKLVSELSKVKSLGINREGLREEIERAMTLDPFLAPFILATIKLSDDFKKGLIPKEFGNIDRLGRRFRDVLRLKKATKNQDPLEHKANPEEIYSVDLPPLLKQVLIGVIVNSPPEKLNEMLH